MLLDLRKKDIKEYEATVDYLINDIYNWDLKADIKQELLLFLFNLILKIEEKESQIENIDNYIFLSLKNKRNSLLMSSKYNHKEEHIKDEEIEFIKAEEDTSSFDLRLQKEIRSIVDKHLNSSDRIIIKSYFFENKSMKLIGEDLGITQQAISKRIKKIVSHLKYILIRYYPNLI